MKKYSMAGRAIELLAVVVLALPLFGCSGKQLTPEQQLQKARAHQSEGKLQTSVIELKNLLQGHPNNADGRLLLGRVYLELGDGPSAEKELAQARNLGIASNEVTVPLAEALLQQQKYKKVIADIKPDSVKGESAEAEVHVVRAQAYLGLGKLAAASSALDEALKLKPSLVSAEVVHAQLAMVREDLDSARKWAQKALQSAPKSAKAWSVFGDINRLNGKLKESANAYKKAIANEHNRIIDRLKLALVEVRMKDYKSATEQLDRVKKKTHHNPGVSYITGLIHLQKKNYADAQNSFEDAIRYAPNYLPALIALGMAHLEQGHYQQADQYLAQAVSRAPRLDEVRLPLAIARYRLKDYAGVESALEPAVAAKKASSPMLRLLAAADMAQGKTEQAITYMKEIAAANPESANTRIALGLGLMDAGDLADGIKQLDSATKLDPEVSQTQVVLVLGYLKAHQPDKALAAAEKYRKAHPKEALSYNLVGGCYLGLQQLDQAKAAFKKALEVSPGDPASAQNLARLEIQDGKLDKARALYESVLKVHPKNVRTLISLAGVERAQGRANDYAKTLRRATEADSNALEPRLLLAQYYVDKGDTAQARSAVQPLQQKYQNVPILMAINGQIQLASGQTQHAITTLQSVTSAAPRWAKGHYLLARAYAAANRRTDSVTELNNALSIAPDYPEARIALAKLLLTQNKLDQARKQVSVLSQHHPRMPAVIGLEGELALRQGKPKEAVAAFRRLAEEAPSTAAMIALAQAQMRAGEAEEATDTLAGWTKEHPEDIGSRMALGNLYLERNQLPQAQQEFESVVKASPKNVQALNNLAWLLRENNPTAALNYARQAVSLAPKAPPVLDTYGMVLLIQGNVDKAVESFRKAADIAPAYAPARYHLALGLVRAGEKKKAKAVLQKLLSQPVENPTKAQARELLKSLGS